MAKTLKNFRQLAYVISDTVTSSFSIFPPSSSPLPHLYLFLPVFPFLALLPHTIIVPLHVSFSYYLTYLTSKFSSMNRSTPGLPVHHQLLESTQTHVHRVGDAIQPSSILSSVVPFSSCPQSFPASRSFQMSQLFA